MTSREAPPSERRSAPRSVADGQLLKAALDSLSQGLAVFDAERRLSAWNDRFFELLDLPAELRRRGVTLEALLRVVAERGDFGPGDVEEAVRRESERLLVPGDRPRLHLTPGGRAI